MTQFKGGRGAGGLENKTWEEGPFFKEENGKPLFQKKNHEDHEQRPRTHKPMKMTNLKGKWYEMNDD